MLDRGPAAEEHECAILSGSCNTTISDTIDIFGCRTDDGTYFNVYRVFVQANTRISVRARSGAFSPLVLLMDPTATNVLGSSAGGRNVDVTVTYDVMTSGDYLVGVAASDSFSSGGAFTLATTCSAIQPPPPPQNCTACTPTSTTACLLGNRFKVDVNWTNHFVSPPTSGTARVIRYAENKPEIHPTLGPLSESAFFEMFAPARVELVVKALSGTGINNKFWIFAVSLTDVEYTIRVTDTRTCATWQRTNPSGTFGNITDFEAFAFP